MHHINQFKTHLEAIMTTLKNYKHFAGRHYETGAVHNLLAYQGVKAPHTGQPLSEATLLGISGGLAFGYFTFAYQGYTPHMVLLTRNTFDPLPALLERLGMVQEVLQTTNAKKAEANLLEVLESGRPALVWADAYSLPYNNMAAADKMWAMFPLVVFGYDGQEALIADRSGKPFTVAASDFQKARARVKQDKFRVMALDLPDTGKVASAVHKGLCQSLRLFTEGPPRGTRNNFGLSGMQHWARMLINTRNPQGWERFFPAGPKLWAALVGHGTQPGLFNWILAWGDGGAERERYAQALDEAAKLLKRPKLTTAASSFRRAHAEWQTLGAVALPERVRAFRTARALLAEREKRFITQGPAALKEIKQINQHLAKLDTAASKKFPLTGREVVALRQAMSEQVLKIHALEQEAVGQMEKALA
jgi:hypothetical protein